MEILGDKISFFNIGDILLLRDHKRCIQNMYDMLKPGGILIIDHRNYDYILKNGRAPKKNIYYNSQNIKSIKTQIIYEDNKPRQIVLDYKMDVEGDGDFVLSYQPWTLAEFSNLLKVCKRDKS